MVGGREGCWCDSGGGNGEGAVNVMIDAVTNGGGGVDRGETVVMTGTGDVGELLVVVTVE